MTIDHESALPADIDEAFAWALAPVQPPAPDALKARLLRRVRDQRRAAEPILPGLITLRADGPGWTEMLPGVSARLMYTDGVAESYLVRIAPGGRAPAHPHPADEECLVLEGELRLGDVHLRAGDFHIARAGAEHGELVSDTGALVFLRYSRPLGEYLRL